MTGLILVIGLIVFLMAVVLVVLSVVQSGKNDTQKASSLSDKTKKATRDKLARGISSSLHDAGKAGVNRTKSGLEVHAGIDPQPVSWDISWLKSQFLKDDMGIYHNVDLVPETAWGDIKLILDRLIKMPIEVNELLRILNSPDSSASSVAEVCDRSVSITAMVLKLVNSPYYGLKQKIDDITHAVALLGFDEIRHLVITMSLFSKSSETNDTLTVQDLFEHSIASAHITTWLTRKIQIKAKPSLSGTGAMLQGIGKMFMLKWRPVRFIQVVKLSREKEIPLMEAELAELGMTHALAGFFMSQRWLMPPNLSRLIKGSHIPELDPDLPEMAIVHLSGQIARQHLNLNDGEFCTDEIREDIRDFLGVGAETISDLVSLDFDEYWESTYSGKECIKA